MTTTIFYLSVKAVSATYILYKVWNMIFSQRMYDFWNMLHNWARIARIRLWKYRKKRMEEKARKDRRKARMQRLFKVVFHPIHFNLHLILIWKLKQ